MRTRKLPIFERIQMAHYHQSIHLPPPGSFLNKFDGVRVDDVYKLIWNAPPKQSALDPLPTWLHKKCADDLSPYIAALCNISLNSGYILVHLLNRHTSLHD